MTSADFRTFIDTLAGGHRSWLASQPSPTGSEFRDHYVGDETHTAGLLRTYEVWRSEHGYIRVRPLERDGGALSLIARVTSEQGGTGATTRLPTTGAYPVPGRHGDIVRIEREIFRGAVAEDLTVEIFRAEAEGRERTALYRRHFKGDPKNWLGEYKPSDQARDPDNVGDWQLWYRIEEG